MPRLPLVLPWLLSTLAVAAVAQHSPGYAEFQQRDIKALSPEQVRDLHEGRGMGLSLPAELNGSPGPMHVLQLRDKLGVTSAQASQIEQVRTEMTAAARRLGASIVQEERALDAAFKSGTADEPMVQSLAERIGALNGELRAAHLVAHLKTRRLLTPTQVAAYDAERGYAGQAGETAPPAKHSH
jgi:Spy/CpxP family protein refolding chaperone